MASTSSESKIITGYFKRIIGSPVGESIPLTDEDVTIGRARTSGICVLDPNISRNHCILKYTTNGWSITDLGGCNGTFLDGKRMLPNVAKPLTDGLGIYLGPPKEAPAAFIFLKSTGVYQAPRTDQTDLQLRNNSVSLSQTLIELNNDHPTLKRRAIPGSSTDRPSVYSKKKNTLAASSCIPVNNTPGIDSQNTVEQVSDQDISDCSISSTDSLRTRVRKINSAKKKQTKRDCLIKIDDQNVASTSASSLRINLFNQNGFESIPSTSTASTGGLPYKMSRMAEKLPTLKVEKPVVFKELDQLLNEGSDSCHETGEGEDSESLLNDSMLLADCDPYPFSQPLPIESSISVNQEQCSANASHSNSVKGKSQNIQEITLHEQEQLKKTNSKLLQENVTQRQKLNQLLEEMKAKDNPTTLLGNMLEEELICNICTEIFIKATTLGCSHTFCEHCITEWKKKQKKCPMCREMITSETRVLILDNFIDKVVDRFDEEYKNKRKELISNREEAKHKEKKPKRKKIVRSRSRRGIRRFTPAHLPQLRFDDLLVDVPYPIVELGDTSTLSDESDSDPSVEGSGYFGGYGRCYSCGRRGHWSNGCPYL